AADEKTTPSDLADKNAAIFRNTFKEFGATNDDFIRTTEPRHKQAVLEIVRRLEAAGDIYLGAYEGWYDEGQEEFITETEAKDAEYKSKISKRPLVRYKEPTYFFKLTKYVDAVTKAIASDEILIRPQSRKNEVLSKLKGWDQDLSISRASLKWGIPMPSDPEHVLYVWIDALSNYITALGWPTDEKSDLIKYWPADVHLIGKEILWFHAFYWPAMLMALGQKLPRVLFAHGWWTSSNQKMGKSLGNFIGVEKLRELSEKFGQDSLRFYMLKAAPFGNDLDWTDAEFTSSYSEIGNVLGNLLNRGLNMLQKYRNGSVPSINVKGPEDDALRAAIDAFPKLLDDAYEKIELQRAAILPLELARAANTY
ncbi:MAG TPA: class I tRNA ligase family protein, partial [Tepidisphaeraceae bacterium]|nr:class I tRNA ligase family protein [Tepidisphaeraceae bacterium]